jgi:hypothetical protein
MRSLTGTPTDSASEGWAPSPQSSYDPGAAALALSPYRLVVVRSRDAAIPRTGVAKRPVRGADQWRGSLDLVARAPRETIANVRSRSPLTSLVLVLLLVNALPAFVVLQTVPNRTKDWFVWTIQPDATTAVSLYLALCASLVVFGVLGPLGRRDAVRVEDRVNVPERGQQRA